MQQTVDAFGREAGFEKRPGSWYRRTDEVIVVVNLQKSQYGRRYYVNVAFWLRGLGDERYPKEEKCHVRLRLEDALPEAEEEITRLLDLEQPLSDEVRTHVLGTLLLERLGPIVDASHSQVGLRALRDEGLMAGAGITGPAQQLLGPDSRK